MSSGPIRSFEEFWPHYVRAHSNKTNRLLHFAGTTAAVACAAGAVLLRRPKLALAGTAIGYAASWIGHFFVEGNTPASFGHPLWSFAADFVMWSKIATGTMDAEVEKYAARPEEPAAPANDVDPRRAEHAYATPTDRYAVN